MNNEPMTVGDYEFILSKLDNLADWIKEFPTASPEPSRVGWLSRRLIVADNINAEYRDLREAMDKLMPHVWEAMEQQ